MYSSNNDIMYGSFFDLELFTGLVQQPYRSSSFVHHVLTTLFALTLNTSSFSLSLSKFLQILSLFSSTRSVFYQMPLCKCPKCKAIDRNGLNVSKMVKFHHQQAARTKAQEKRADDTGTTGIVKEGLCEDFVTHIGGNENGELVDHL